MATINHDQINQFLFGLVEKIKAGKSQCQELAALIERGILTGMLPAFYRDPATGKPTDEHGRILGKDEDLVERPRDSNDFTFGWLDSREVNITVLSLYEEMLSSGAISYDSDQLKSEADREIRATIRNASGIAAKRCGIASHSTTEEPTKTQIMLDTTPEALASKICGFYVKRGDWDFIEKTITEMQKLRNEALAEDVTSNVPEEEAVLA